MAVALVAQRLDDLRDQWLNQPERVEWLDEPVPGLAKASGFLVTKRGERLDCRQQAIYNERLASIRQPRRILISRAERAGVKRAVQGAGVFATRMCWLEEDAMANRDEQRMIGKLMADCDRWAAQSAVTDEYLDMLARTAAVAIKDAATRKNG